jgi:hypothetical protein
MNNFPSMLDLRIRRQTTEDTKSTKVIEADMAGFQAGRNVAWLGRSEDTKSTKVIEADMAGFQAGRNVAWLGRSPKKSIQYQDVLREHRALRGL